MLLVDVAKILTSEGVTIQSMDRTLRSLPHRPLPHDLLRLVGPTLRQHLRLTTGSAHARLRLLRLQLHDIDNRPLAAVSIVLLCAKHGYENMSSSHSIPAPR